MIKNPDERLAEEIIDMFKKEKILADRELEKFEKNFKSGTLTQEDWKRLAESLEINAEEKI